MKANTPEKRAGFGQRLLRLGWGRLLLAPLMVLAVLLMWWGVRRLGPESEAVREASSRVNQLGAQVDRMRLELEQAGGPEGVLAEIEVTRSRLFRSRNEIEAWVRAVEAQSVPFLLDVGVTFGTPVARVITNETLTVLPVSLEVRPRPQFEAVRRPFERVLDLAAFLGTSGRRVDLVQLEARGNSNSVDQARLHLQLWASSLEASNP